MKQSQTGEFYGQTNKTINLEGITLTDTVYTLDKVDWHYHENAYFTFILQGNVIEGNKKKSTIVLPGIYFFTIGRNRITTSNRKVLQGVFTSRSRRIGLTIWTSVLQIYRAASIFQTRISSFYFIKFLGKQKQMTALLCFRSRLCCWKLYQKCFGIINLILVKNQPGSLKLI